MNMIDDFSRGADALEQQDYLLARRCFETWLAQHPEDSDAWQNLGVAWFYTEDFSQAQRCWQQALAFSRDPAHLEDTILEAAHELAHDRLNNQAAIGFYRLLLDSPRLSREAHFFLFIILASREQLDEALQVANTAIKKFPNEISLRLQKTFLLPNIYHSDEEMRHCHTLLEQRLADLEAWLASNPALEAHQVLTYSPLFNLMPLGLNEKTTFQRISRIWRRLFIEADAEQLRAAPRKPGPLRLALISASVWNHSTMHYFRGMIEMLAQQTDIETGLFDFAKQHDPMTDHIKGLVHHYERLPRILESARDAITRWQPDVLMYLDIGQETLLYTLAHYRLAPVQCVTAGVPITTGIDTIDYYLSCRQFEKPQAQEHYSEKLILLDQMMVCMRPPQLAAERKSRADFGMAADSHVYFFPHTLFRLDPELDAVLAGILQADPLAEIYGMRLMETHYHHLLQSRFAASYPELSTRLHFLPWMNQPDFLELLSLADVALDAHRLAGGNVSFQTFWVGTPMVVYPSAFLRGRIGAGLYRLMGLEEWIAHDWQDYLSKALRLGTDPICRQRVSEQILAARETIFNRPEGIEEIFAWFRRWGAG